MNINSNMSSNNKLPPNFQPFNKCAKEAARLGKIRTHTILDAINAIKEGPVSKPKKFTNNQAVFVINNNTFLKSLDVRATQEERSIIERFAFSPESAVPSYSFQNLELERLDIPLDNLAPACRRFSIRTMPYLDQKKFSKLLTDENVSKLWKSAPHPEGSGMLSEQFDINRESYTYYSKQQFKIVIGDKILILTFDELMRYKEKNSFSTHQLIAIKDDSNFYTFNDFYLNYFAVDNDGNIHKIYDAINFYNQTDKSRQAFFTFQITDEKTLDLIKQFEQCQLEYKNEKGEWESTTFQKFYKIWVLKKYHLRQTSE